MKIYVASSWRNEQQSAVVEHLRRHGHEVYDFKNPPNNSGFSWSEISSEWENWSVADFISALSHDCAERGFKSDFDAMKWADACVMVNPCGSSAHLELGWMSGAGKISVVYCAGIRGPELMIKVADLITDDLNEITDYFNEI